MQTYTFVFYARPHGSIGVFSDRPHCCVRADSRDQAIKWAIDAVNRDGWETRGVAREYVTGGSSNATL